MALFRSGSRSSGARSGRIHRGVQGNFLRFGEPDAPSGARGHVDRIIGFSASHQFLDSDIVGGAGGSWGWQSLKQTPLDALPDLNDKQVIVHSRWDRSHDLKLDARKSPHPIVSALLGAPG